MSTDITVVRVELHNPNREGRYRVTFSEPVHLFNYGMSTAWNTEGEDNRWLETDALGAYMWGLWVISKQEEWRDAYD